MASDPTDVAVRLRLSITRLSRVLRQQEPISVGPTLTSALATLNDAGPLTIGDLAAREHVTPPSISRVVDRLVEKGLAARGPDPRDGRVVRVEVTKAGRKQITEGRTRRTAWLAGRLRELPPDELDCLARAATIIARLAEAEVPTGA